MASIVDMPKLGFDMSEGTLVRWVLREGDSVNKGAILAEIETDKATVEVESAFSGILHRILVQEGDVVPVGTHIAVIGEAGEKIDYQVLTGTLPIPDKGAKPVSLKPTESGKSQISTRREIEQDGHLPEGVKATPLARHIAKDKSIDLHAVKGSGPQGRITKHDVETFSKLPVQTSLGSSPLTAILPPVPSTPALSGRMGEVPADKRIPLTRLRATIGKRMQEARQQIPHFYVTHVYDMSAVISFREEINIFLEEAGEKISIHDFIVLATALCLRKYPNLNASIEGQETIQHGHINIGSAVALGEGLLTVVCQDTDKKSLRQISIELHAMTTRARQGKVRPEDIEGSTFSISNLGMFDVEHFIAIINPPEAAILAVGSIQDVPVLKNNEIKAGAHMKATISVDHRISDGAEAARFLQDLAGYLEHPIRLLI